MDSNRFELVGGKELMKALKDLGDNALAVRVVRQVSMKEAKRIEDALRSAAPEDTGRLRTFVARKSGTSKKAGRVRIQVGVLARSQKQLSKLGLSHGVHYAAFTNYGTKFQPAQHWADKAVEATAQPYLNATINALKERVEREGARLGKR